MPTPTASPLAVRRISAAEHLEFLRTHGTGHVSFLQTPGWGAVKAEWRTESIGWFSTDASGPGHDTPVGVGLVLYRQLPKLRRYLAYLPEGPVIDWDGDRLADWLRPMAAHLKAQGAFAIRMGPPVVTARWTAAQVKEGIADDAVRRLTEVAPTERSPSGARVTGTLRDLGWRELVTDEGFAAGQPQYNFAIPLRHPDGTPRTEDEVLKGMNQLWRRNIKKAAKNDVRVERGDAADLPAFHELYRHTAERDGFTPRPLGYFETMFAALDGQGAVDDGAGVSEIRLYLARHDGDLVAATIWVRVGRYVWYSYGASSTEKREVRGSNAIQWEMIRDALAAGAEVYDLRGITDTLDPEDSHVGLIQFKVGTGGAAIGYVGEWDLPVNRLLHKAFELYLRRR